MKPITIWALLIKISKIRLMQKSIFIRPQILIKKITNLILIPGESGAGLDGFPGIRKSQSGRSCRSSSRQREEGAGATDEREAIVALYVAQMSALRMSTKRRIPTLGKALHKAVKRTYLCRTDDYERMSLQTIRQK